MVNLVEWFEESDAFPSASTTGVTPATIVGGSGYVTLFNTMGSAEAGEVQDDSVVSFLSRRSK